MTGPNDRNRGTRPPSQRRAPALRLLAATLAVLAWSSAAAQADANKAATLLAELGTA